MSETFVLPTEEEELAELARLIGQPVMPPSESDAWASELLGRMAAAQRDLARYDAACRREVMRIETRYDTLKENVEARIELLERAICALAERADFGKVKSRKVGNGSYGRRTVPARVEVMDAVALVEWAKLSSDDRVRGMIVVKEHVPAVEATAYFRETGEVPDGCVGVLATEKPFAKPELEDENE